MVVVVEHWINSWGYLIIIYLLEWNIPMWEKALTEKGYIYVFHAHLYNI